MRFDVKKYLLIGLEKDKKSFFAACQTFGFVQFIDPKFSGSKPHFKNLELYSSAIRILSKLPAPVEIKELPAHSAFEIAKQAVDFAHQIDQTRSACSKTEAEIALLSPLGNFSRDEFEKMANESNRKVQFFAAGKNTFKQAVPEVLIYITSSEIYDYYISIQPHSLSFPELIALDTSESLKEKNHRLKELHEWLRLLTGNLNDLRPYVEQLKQACHQEIDTVNLESSQSYAQSAEEKLFTIESWIPELYTERVKSICEEFDIFMEEIKVEPHETIPTFLNNQGVAQIGEDLVELYDTPSSADEDPSLWVLVSFAFFFAFMVSDAGYGLVFLATALYMQWKNRSTSLSAKRGIQLLAILGASCIIWGTLTSAFFGIELSPENPLTQVSLTHFLSAKKAEYLSDNIGSHKELSDQILLEMAILIGIIHITLSILRYLKRNPQNIGWILFMWGAYCYFPPQLEAVSLAQIATHLSDKQIMDLGLGLMLSGVTLVMGISLYYHGLMGLLEILLAIQIFSDILSYLRLYALSIAGALIAGIINEFAGKMTFVFYIPLLIFGHGINILLALMGGAIHGLRLNFLEWYHYSFEGGGKPFQPLKTLTSENTK